MTVHLILDTFWARSISRVIDLYTHLSLYMEVNYCQMFRPNLSIPIHAWLMLNKKKTIPVKLYNVQEIIYTKYAQGFPLEIK